MSSLGAPSLSDCFRPSPAWFTGNRTKNGGKEITFNFRKSARGRELLRFFPDQEADATTPDMLIPCRNKCIACNIKRAGEWAFRCEAEGKSHGSSYFVTCTYSPENLPAYGSLVPSDHTDFVKRVRHHFGEVRFFMCGEYGDKKLRPHYHYNFFGLVLDDLEELEVQDDGSILYHSPKLSEVWGVGDVFVCDFSFGTAAYTARYCLKKIVKSDPRYFDSVSGLSVYQRVDVLTGEIYEVEPEFIRMSNRPGIGADWFAEFGEDCHKGFLTRKGKRVRLPEYFLTLMERSDPEVYEHLKAVRTEAVCDKAELWERGELRLDVRERCAESYFGHARDRNLSRRRRKVPALV